MLFTDEDQNYTTFLCLDKEVTPEVGDKYVHASEILPLGIQMMHGNVRAHIWDCDGNPICHRSNNPIIDTHLYVIEFPSREVTLLTAHIIVQVMFAQCDVDGNKYLILKCFVDVQKDSNVIS